MLRQCGWLNEPAVHQLGGIETGTHMALTLIWACDVIPFIRYRLASNKSTDEFSEKGHINNELS